MVVGGDRHADRDDDGPVPRDARHRALVVVAKMILDILFSRLVGWFSAPFKISVSAVNLFWMIFTCFQFAPTPSSLLDLVSYLCPTLPPTTSP